MVKNWHNVSGIKKKVCFSEDKKLDQKYMLHNNLLQFIKYIKQVRIRNFCKKIWKIIMFLFGLKSELKHHIKPFSSGIIFIE